MGEGHVRHGDARIGRESPEGHPTSVVRGKPYCKTCNTDRWRRWYNGQSTSKYASRKNRSGQPPTAKGESNE